MDQFTLYGKEFTVYVLLEHLRKHKKKSLLSQILSSAFEGNFVNTVCNKILKEAAQLPQLAIYIVKSLRRYTFWFHLLPSGISIEIILVN